MILVLSEHLDSRRITWGDILYIWEFKKSAPHPDGQGSIARSICPVPSGKHVEKLKHSSPYTTPVKAGQKVALNSLQQCARYTGYVLSTSILRRNAVVQLIDDARTQTTFLDRSNAIISAKEPIENDPALLIGPLVALITAQNSHLLGFEPALVGEQAYPHQTVDLVIKGLENLSSRGDEGIREDIIS
jgi:hypothetical protein